MGAINDAPAFIAQLQSIASAHDVLRIKGFLEVTGKPMRLLVQGVGTRFRHHFDGAWPAHAPRAGSLVFIGEKGMDRTAITKALTAML